jgi:hypothetical protein
LGGGTKFISRQGFNQQVSLNKKVLHMNYTMEKDLNKLGVMVEEFGCDKNAYSCRGESHGVVHEFAQKLRVSYQFSRVTKVY